MGRRIQQEGADAGLSSASVLQCSTKVYFRTHPIHSCYTQGVPPIYYARMTGANLGLGRVGQRGIEHARALPCFSFYLFIVYVCIRTNVQ